MTVRVLWLTKGLGRGGAETLLVTLSRHIDRSKVDLEVAYVLAHKDLLVDRLRSQGVPTYCLSSSPGGWVSGLRRILREGQYDVVHTHSPVVASAARLLAPRGTRLVHTEHNTWGRYRRPTAVANALTLPRTEVVWAVSEGVAESMRPWFPRSWLPPIEVMVHGIDFDEVQHGDQARAEARKRLGVADDTFVVGTVGNLTAKKNQAALLRAFAATRRHVEKAHLVLIGSGPLESRLREQAAHLGIAQEVTFLGTRSDVADLLPGLDLFALSSAYEGLSIALVEALAAGVPVLASRAGGIPEVVRHGVSGWLVPVQDQRALNRALSLLMTDHSLRARLSDAAPIRARAFDIRQAAAALTTYYTAPAPDLELRRVS